MCKCFQYFVLAGVLACVQAGLIGAPLATTYAAAPAYAAYGHAALAPAAITSQSANILRSYGNLGQVSTYSKTIDTPYSSVTKSDVRVSNPGVLSVSPSVYAFRSTPVVFRGPLYVTRTSDEDSPSDAVTTTEKSTTESTNDSESMERLVKKPKDREPLEPTGTLFIKNLQPSATKKVSHSSWSSSFLTVHTPLKVYVHSPYAPLIGVAYSSAPEVSHLTFANAHGLQYAW